MFRKLTGPGELISLLVLSVVSLLSIFIVGQKTTFFNKAYTPDVQQKSLTPITKKAQLVIFNPIMTHHGNIRLIDYFNQNWPGLWNDPVAITNKIITDLNSVSGGYVNYQIAETKIIDTFPILTDGYQYDDDSWLACWGNDNLCHQPQMMDYAKELNILGSCDKRNSGAIDEAWLWGSKAFGFWESNLAGPGAFWYNSSPTTGTSCQHLLPIMGWNYAVGQDNALHSYSHRVESTMIQVYGPWAVNESTPWNTYSLYDQEFPGHARCGNVHFPPNAVQGYDYTNTRTVSSACDDWYAYPNLPNPPNYKPTTCTAWGCNQYGYQKWWLNHLPKASGGTNNIWNNWWKYIVDYENATASPPPPTNTVKLTASDDTRISTAHPDSAYCKAPNLILMNNPAVSEADLNYFKFDLSSIPTNKTIDFAKFQFYVQSIQTPPPMSVNLKNVIGNWSETACPTNNRQPQLEIGFILQKIGPFPPGQNTIDLPGSYIQSRLGVGWLSFRMQYSSKSNSVQFIASKNNIQGYPKPTLIISYH